MISCQPGILAPIPPLGRYIEFGLVPDTDPRANLRSLAGVSVDESVVVGVGPSLVLGLERRIEGLRPFPGLSGPGCGAPSTQADLWLWLRGTDRGAITLLARSLVRVLRPAFRADRIVDGFRYGRGLDLTGYEDGTENPKGEDAVTTAIVGGAGPGLDGSSFVAVQQWAHDLDHFGELAPGERDNIIGRRLSNNEEFEDAPDWAHVKRTA